MSFLQISLLNFLLWFFAGIITAFFMQWYDKQRVSGGIIITSFYAVVGALSAGYLASFLSGKALQNLSFEGLVIAGVGALIWISFYRFSFRI